MQYEPKAVTTADIPARYQELCAQRDAVNEQNAPLEAQLAAANAEVMAAQDRANALAAEIDNNRGRDAWIAMKKEIGILAKMVSGGR